MGAPAFVRFSIERCVGWLEFNRPPVNAFTRPMVDETHDGIATALADPEVRVVQVCKEDEGLSICAGLHAAGHKSVMMMQYTGLLDSINALRGVGVEGDATAHDLGALYRVGGRARFDDEPEAVEELRARIAGYW